jgi:3-deoxy-manno-octulosonate cytidylyltransferase (CMP-KDO synthetase)
MRIVIPARFGSSRFPGKPLALIDGQPMIQRVYTCAAASHASEVVIATDDERIAEAADGFGASVCMTASTHTSGTDRIAEVIEILGWDDDEIIVNLQGDEPLMPVELLNQVAEDLEHHTDAAIATLAVHLDDPDQVFDPNVVKVVTDKKGYALYFSRAAIPWIRDELSWGNPVAPDVAQGFRRHIGLYAYRAGFIREYVTWPPAPIETDESLEQLRVLWNGRRIHVSMASVLPPPGVDTPEDLQKVEQLIRDTAG